MPHYEENFELNETDVELIEDTIRNQIRVLTGKKLKLSDSESDGLAELEDTIKQLNMLLGKFHNQKIWYSQVNQTGVPLG